MSEPVISVHGLSKAYRLGVISRHTLQDEIRYWWHRCRGRNPLDHMGKIGLAGGRISEADGDDGRFWALKDVSFEVQPGEVVGIIGRNGAGKSTILKLLSRITAPTGGEAIINGRVGSLLEVGTGFHPELTGRENIYMNGTILGMKKAEIDRKFDEIVAFSELEEFLDTPVKRYSSGMYVRLAFAVAAHLEPEILLVDEVLAVGDASFQKKCLSKMEDVSQAGRTVLFVSHNMPAVARLCSRTILFERGRILDSGPSERIVSAYLANAAASEVSRVWTHENAPGTREVRLLKVEIIRPDGTAITVARVTEELIVKLTYHVGVPGCSFRCLISFCTQGVIAFTALEPTEEVRETVGVYSSKVTIPSNLLAENEYILHVSIFASRGAKMHYVKVKDVVAFQATDPIRGDSARGDYTERLSGMLRPLLKWDMAKE